MNKILNDLLAEHKPSTAWGIFLVALGFAFVVLAYVGGTVLWLFLNFWGYDISYWNAVIGYALTFALLMLLPLRRSK